MQLNIVFVGGSVISQEIKDITIGLLNTLASKELLIYGDSPFMLIDMSHTSFEKLVAKKFDEMKVGEILQLHNLENKNKSYSAVYKNEVVLHKAIKFERKKTRRNKSEPSEYRLVRKYIHNPGKISKLTFLRYSALLKGLKHASLIVAVPDSIHGRGAVALKYAMVNNIPYIDLTESSAQKRIDVIKDKIEKVIADRENRKKRAEKAAVHLIEKRKTKLMDLLNKNKDLAEHWDHNDAVEMMEEFFEVEDQELHEAPPAPKPLMKPAVVPFGDLDEVIQKKDLEEIQTVLRIFTHGPVCLGHERLKHCVGEDKINSAHLPEHKQLYSLLIKTINNINQQYEVGELSNPTYEVYKDLIKHGAIVFAGVEWE